MNFSSDGRKEIQTEAWWRRHIRTSEWPCRLTSKTNMAFITTRNDHRAKTLVHRLSAIPQWISPLQTLRLGCSKPIPASLSVCDYCYSSPPVEERESIVHQAMTTLTPWAAPRPARIHPSPPSNMGLADGHRVICTRAASPTDFLVSPRSAKKTSRIGRFRASPIQKPSILMIGLYSSSQRPITSACKA